jgi:hypothetical protein
MSQDPTITNGAPSVPNDRCEAFRWIRCEGCRGEVGIPSDWNESTVDCPECGMAVQVLGRVLYRTVQPVAHSVPQQAPPPTPAPRTRSLDRLIESLLKHAFTAIGASVVMACLIGWQCATSQEAAFEEAVTHEMDWLLRDCHAPYTGEKVYVQPDQYRRLRELVRQSLELWRYRPCLNENHRLMIARQMGLTLVPVEQRMAYIARIGRSE